MHVALLEDVNSLGPKGSTVDVPEGYAINFLFPQHLAVKVSADTATDKEEVANLKKIKKTPMSPDQQLAGDVDGLEVILQVPVKKGKIAAPVTATEVRAALKEMGYKLPKSAIKMTTIDSLGSVEVPVKFDSGFEATLTVVVENKTD